MIDTSQTAQMAQIARTALNYCRLGASDAQLAEFFGVSPETIGGWLADSAEFAAAVRRGRKMADVEIVDSLHRLGTGFVETVEKVMICRGEPMVVTYQKQHRPDYKAGVMWLCNRMPEQWSWPGARRQEKAVVEEAADLFSLPLLVDEEPMVDDEPVIAGSAPLRGAHAVSTRREERDWSRALPAMTTPPVVRPPPLQPVLAAA